MIDLKWGVVKSRTTLLVSGSGLAGFLSLIFCVAADAREDASRFFEDSSGSWVVAGTTGIDIRSGVARPGAKLCRADNGIVAILLDEYGSMRIDQTNRNANGIRIVDISSISTGKKTYKIISMDIRNKSRFGNVDYGYSDVEIVTSDKRVNVVADIGDGSPNISISMLTKEIVESRSVTIKTNIEGVTKANKGVIRMDTRPLRAELARCQKEMLSERAYILHPPK